ncbi:hypothetical protein A3Q56_00452 [Intoshia linei]|uniref:Phosphotransferase n=1 Tax=Intoshia linei TaxID=1819745 RepID=A0A177BBQ5_9BILA|nr:hypothetical protein A3Q56_00452 [Intoshia linei]
MTDVNERLNLILSDFDIPWNTYDKISQLMNQEIENVLTNKNINNSLKMLNSFVKNVPLEAKDGKYLALDLGGTHFRVSLIELHGSIINSNHKIYEVPKEIKRSTTDELFNFVTDSLKNFLSLNNLSKEKLYLGFTFSFPVSLKSLNEGIIISWTKNFQINDGIGKDVSKILMKHIQDKNINVVCRAIINDTVGCLMSTAFDHKLAKIGVILGTGTNACYFEKTEKMKTWEERHDFKSDQVLINTEWGCFGENGVLDFILTKYDIELDKNSLNPTKSIFEKMISGMYLGEITRRVFLKCIEEKLIFNGKLSDIIKQQFTINTTTLSIFAEGDYEKVWKNILSMGYNSILEKDIEIMSKVCDMISKRAAFLAAAGISCLIKRLDVTDKDEIIVGIDGGLFKCHPNFEKYIKLGISKLIMDRNVSLKLSIDGSAIGAAIVAMSTVE